MKQKNIVATIFIKNGKAYPDPHPNEQSQPTDVVERAQFLSDGGSDRILLLDLSDNDEEHEKNLLLIKELNRNIEIKTCGAGNIQRLEDVKKLLYAGCAEVAINGSKPEAVNLVKEACGRFGKEKTLVSLMNIDFLFKARDIMDEMIHEFIILNDEIIDSVCAQTNTPCIVLQNNVDIDVVAKTISSSDKIHGILGPFVDENADTIMDIKANLSDRGIRMNNFEASLSWSDLKPGADGLIPVVVQDYKTQAVLMVAYMNEESFNMTIRIGKMTYYSRSRQELWVKGMTSGHIQYVKSLTADCDYDTILAKVSQAGGIACHTGRPSCFFNEIVKKEYIERNPLKVFENVYDVIADRKVHPREGSYTNYLFDKGIDKILKKVGEEASEIIIAAKNPNREETIYEISDFLYHMMVLMAERDITWEDITRELAHR